MLKGTVDDSLMSDQDNSLVSDQNNQSSSSSSNSAPVIAIDVPLLRQQLITRLMSDQNNQSSSSSSNSAHVIAREVAHLEQQLLITNINTLGIHTPMSVLRNDIMLHTRLVELYSRFSSSSTHTPPAT